MSVNSEIKNVKFLIRPEAKWTWEHLEFQRERDCNLTVPLCFRQLLPTESANFLYNMKFAEAWGRLMQAKMSKDGSSLTKDIVRESMKEMVNYWCPSFSDKGKKEQCQIGKEMLVCFWIHGEKLSSLLGMDPNVVSVWQSKVNAPKLIKGDIASSNIPALRRLLAGRCYADSQ